MRAQGTQQAADTPDPKVNPCHCAGAIDRPTLDQASCRSPSQAIRREADTFSESLFTMRPLADVAQASHSMHPMRYVVNLALKSIEPRLFGRPAAGIKGCALLFRWFMGLSTSRIRGSGIKNLTLMREKFSSFARALRLVTSCTNPYPTHPTASCYE
jgi:hypothetical protein